MAVVVFIYEYSGHLKALLCLPPVIVDYIRNLGEYRKEPCFIPQEEEETHEKLAGQEDFRRPEVKMMILRTEGSKRLESFIYCVNR